MPCPFCKLPPARIVRERASAVLVWDAYPLSPGHALVIPRRHIGSWFDTPDPRGGVRRVLPQRAAYWRRP